MIQEPCPHLPQTHWLLLSFPGSVIHSSIFLLPILCIRSSSIWKLFLDSSEVVPWLPPNSARSTLTSSTISKTGSLQTGSGDPSGQSRSQISIRGKMCCLFVGRGTFLQMEGKRLPSKVTGKSLTEGLNCSAKATFVILILCSPQEKY